MTASVEAARGRFRAIAADSHRHASLRELRDWSYIRRTRKESDQRRLLEYNGPRDLLHWIHGRLRDLDALAANPRRSNGHWSRPAAPQVDALVEASARLHERLLATFPDLDPPLREHGDLDMYNAQDFHYVSSLVPRLATVLDYGAGYGRQAFLFANSIPCRLIAVDAIEQPYLLQEWVFRTLGLRLWEYLDHAADPGLDTIPAKGEGPDVVHLPTWRTDLIPTGSVDAILFVWALYEMSEKAARHAIATCERVLRPDGFVYIRDNPHTVGYGWDPERVLQRKGFRIVYQPWKADDDEIHGVPRLYRRVGSVSGSAGPARAEPRGWTYVPAGLFSRLFRRIAN